MKKKEPNKKVLKEIEFNRKCEEVMLKYPNVNKFLIRNGIRYYELTGKNITDLLTK